MAKNAPGKHYRDGITLAELFQRFPDDKTAEKWFVECRWEHGIRCAYCDSDNVHEHASHATMPYRCRDCKKRFSVKNQFSDARLQSWLSEMSVGEYVREQVHTNGIESFWSMLKRGYMGIYHHMSPKHLHRYVVEFRGRHNRRPMDTIDQMTKWVQSAKSKRLRYCDLIA